MKRMNLGAEIDDEFCRNAADLLLLLPFLGYFMADMETRARVRNYVIGSWLERRLYSVVRDPSAVSLSAKSHYQLWVRAEDSLLSSSFNYNGFHRLAVVVVVVIVPLSERDQFLLVDWLFKTS